MPPPARPVANKPLPSQSQRIPPQSQIQRAPPKEPDPDPESLSVPAGDDDQPWDPPNYENEEEEEMLGWDASNEDPSASFHPTFRDSGSARQPQKERQPPTYSQEGLEPTQRLSQVSAIFWTRCVFAKSRSCMGCSTEHNCLNLNLHCHLQAPFSQ